MCDIMNMTINNLKLLCFESLLDGFISAIAKNAKFTKLGISNHEVYIKTTLPFNNSCMYLDFGTENKPTENKPTY